MNSIINFHKKIKVKVTTQDADLDGITLEFGARGQDLFDIICRIIGIREIWFFGLNYMNKWGISCWLQLEKKIVKQDVLEQSDGSFHFYFLAKFYPENVDNLIQDCTRHLFFLQIQQKIISMEIYCQPEAAVLLASYAVQAQFGDCNDDVELDIEKLLPKAVIDQYDMTPEMWIERIKKWWANNDGSSMEEAEIEYLRISQDLDMFGIQYYPVLNQNESDLLIGISPQGLGVYKLNNRLSPETFFPWKEVKNISCKNKQFSISMIDKSRLKFRAQNDSMIPSIMDICTGSQILYKRQFQPDHLEVQQLKVQANEQRKRRMEEQQRFAKERELRIEAEKERDNFKAEISLMKEKEAALLKELSAAQDMLKRMDETNKLIAEKARVSEKEALELSNRASKAEAEVQRIKLSQLKAEENKMVLERKVRDAEFAAHRLMHQENAGAGIAKTAYCASENEHLLSNGNGVMSQQQQHSPTNPLPGRTNHFAESLSEERWQRQHQQQAHLNGNGVYYEQTPQPQTGRRYTKVEAPPPPAFLLHQQQPIRSSHSQSTSNLFRIQVPNGKNSGCNGVCSTNSVSQMDLKHIDRRSSFHHEIENLYAEVEQMRNRYYEKNKNFQSQLIAFRKQLESLRREENLTENDQVFDAKFRSGFDRYSTLRKSGAGSALKKTEKFNGL